MKIIEHYKSNFILPVTFLILLSVSSCEKYLDKAPEADISDKDVFGNFTSFQGFVEQMYNCVVDPDKSGAWSQYLFADETLNDYPYNFDMGNYWEHEYYFYNRPATPASDRPQDRRVWESSWYGIRAANMALEKIEEEGLFVGTADEKNHLKGQALFFRAWFYFELCRYWGGMPYIDRVLGAEESLITDEFKRLNFQETAKLMARDFRAAADLLPNHWDASAPGQTTLGHNRKRVNKFFALGYLGKSLLYAASPMINEEATGLNAFDEELVQQAADAFGELLGLADLTGLYKMQPWEAWSENFRLRNFQIPGGTECIMTPTIYHRDRVRWSTIGATVPSSLGLNSGYNADVPTHNFVKNYAMANGLPIDDPASGYDPQDPWTGREPRFYEDIVYDGCRIHRNLANNTHAELYNGGRHRSQIAPPSATGYYGRRYNDIGADFDTSIADRLQAYIPYLRLADVYLMYAESLLFSSGGTPQSSSSNYYMTAEQALNVVRNRAQLPDIDPKFTVDNEVFFEEIVRERAVELAFEGARFCDLRRWNRHGDPRYLDKTAIDFDRRADGKPTNLRERVIIRRVVEKKHNWLPIRMEHVAIYKEFPQNPGW